MTLSRNKCFLSPITPHLYQQLVAPLEYAPFSSRTHLRFSTRWLISDAAELPFDGADFYRKNLSLQRQMSQSHSKKERMRKLLQFTLLNRNTLSFNELSEVITWMLQERLLREHLLLAVGDQLSVSAADASPQALTNILHAYASLRFYVGKPIAEIKRVTIAKLHQFPPALLALHISSFARLNLLYDDLFEVCATHILAAPKLSSREAALIFYSYSKLGMKVEWIRGKLMFELQHTIRYASANCLVIILTAYQKLGIANIEFAEAAYRQIEKRKSELSATYLCHLLKVMAAMGYKDGSLISALFFQLPRIAVSAHPYEMLYIFHICCQMKILSPLMLDLFIIAVKKDVKWFHSGALKVIYEDARKANILETPLVKSVLTETFCGKMRVATNNTSLPRAA